MSRAAKEDARVKDELSGLRAGAGVHPMSQRFFVAAPIRGPSAELAGDEAHHLLHVLRAREGDAVTLFDGTGAEFAAQIRRLGRQRVVCEVTCRREVDRELPVPVTLGVALPKGERQRWLVEKAVELGVARLTPLVAERGVAQPTPPVLERLRRAVVEAAKQCGRNRLMEIASPCTVRDFLAAPPTDATRWLAHPEVAADAGPPAATPAPGQAVFLAVGPEGGFSPDELQAASGWRRVSLGPRILRVETAAIALAAWIALGADPAAVLPPPARA